MENIRSAVRLTARTVWGVTVCLLLAVAASYIFSAHPEKVFVPIGFVVVLVLASALYGPMAGILGSVISALVFARLLYSPVGSINIENHAARQSLSWMILGGVAIPYLLLPGMRGQKPQEHKEEKK